MKEETARKYCCFYPDFQIISFHAECVSLSGHHGYKNLGRISSLSPRRKFSSGESALFYPVSLDPRLLFYLSDLRVFLFLHSRWVERSLSGLYNAPTNSWDSRQAFSFSSRNAPRPLSQHQWKPILFSSFFFLSFSFFVFFFSPFYSEALHPHTSYFPFSHFPAFFALKFLPLPFHAYTHARALPVFQRSPFIHSLCNTPGGTLSRFYYDLNGSGNGEGVFVKLAKTLAQVGPIEIISRFLILKSQRNYHPYFVQTNNSLHYAIVVPFLNSISGTRNFQLLILNKRTLICRSSVRVWKCICLTGKQ